MEWSAFVRRRRLFKVDILPCSRSETRFYGLEKQESRNQIGADVPAIFRPFSLIRDFLNTEIKQ
ncbi:MAG: hypothetical protein C4530_20220 [Desulfobacteraceae bacterium]|nr:MAG: hypothetical protein C4530_20220 [Desulfobacteraceae bacterium]